MKVNIYDKISQWLLDCPEMGGYSYFNVIPIDAGSSSVNSNSSSIVLNEYMDGAKEVRLMFNINLVREYDNGGTSDLNLDAIAEFDKVIEFIETKNNNNEYPDLGDNYVVNEIGATYKAPEVYITQDNPSIARYEGQFYIEYLEKKRSEI
jgi:hypothetical protein